MDFFEFVLLALFTVLGFTLITKLISLFQVWIEKRYDNKQNDILADPDFLRALREFKEKTDGRLNSMEYDIKSLQSHNNINARSVSPTETIENSGAIQLEERESSKPIEEVDEPGRRLKNNLNS